MPFDFIKVRKKTSGKNTTIVYPEYTSGHTNDLMIRGNAFYAFWDEELGLWNRDERDCWSRIDQMVIDAANDIHDSYVEVELIKNFSSGLLSKWKKYCKEVGDTYHDLDTNIIFGNTKTKKTDYASRKLPYPLEQQDISAYDELISVLYDKKERRKIEWAIGSIISGDSKDIQKFYVFYGTAGSGKSTILNIVWMLFNGYSGTFRAKDLGNPNNSFALEPLACNPLVAIEHDGDLSRIEDNTRLNSIVSHESMTVNEKYKAPYSMRFNTTLFVGTNSPVRITDSKSGVLRRLIDISPTGNLVDVERYNTLMSKIAFELPGIAYHCLSVYLECGKNYYDKYKPTKMLDETNDMYNFVSDMLWDWEDLEDGVSLALAWKQYKDWCEDSGVPYPLMKRKFKTELRQYFEDFKEHTNKGNNIYVGLLKEKFKIHGEKEEKRSKSWLNMREGDSLLDDILADCKAQYTTKDGIPKAKWVNVKTKLKELDTKELHYVKVPDNHIVIDFDLKNSAGEKDPLLNLEAASKFPQTYAELSKSGSGIHLHYIYDGDVKQLSRIYDDEIEVKVFTGNSSLRRKLSKCNDIPVATINSGLPLKGSEKMIDTKSVENERHLRALIKKSLNKEIHGHTKPEIDFMNKILTDAYANEELSYDIRDMRPAIITFAMSSTNQAQACFETVSRFRYCSKDHEAGDKNDIPGTSDWNKAPIVFFDVEVFPNLFIICWKKIGKDNKVVRMINPTPEEVKRLFSFRLVGFNNRRYDNHIVYARSMGYTNAELFRLSQAIIGKTKNSFFGEAYGLSYTDIYDYCSNANKMGLKKWEIKLGIYHLENAYPWDEDVPEDKWEEIADYCENDVIATEAVWDATQADFRGRQILAELSGLTVNDTSNTHTQQIIFGNDKNPQRYFNCPDLSEEFPGYKFENGVSTYMGETVGEGGWVYAKPGMYVNAVCEDVSGMHPASIYAMNLFGDEYTERYYDLVRARTHIKHQEYDKVREMFDGKLAKYLGSEEEAKALSDALKTPINSVYGLTAAHFSNRCRDPRNKDNVVAKRGALFMITLKNEVEEQGYTVIHCKTDSIKIADPDDYILAFIENFGRNYGYTFEIEDEFERICLVNGSTFIAKFRESKIDKKTGKEKWWYPKAAQFAHPYVFKTLFSKEDICFDDLCETKNVTKGDMYLDMNEGFDDVTEAEKTLKNIIKALKDIWGNNWENQLEVASAAVDQHLSTFDLETIERSNELVRSFWKVKEDISKGHNYHFVGRVGRFTPVIEGTNGGYLVTSMDGKKYDAVQGTKGYRWLESEMVLNLGVEDRIDMRYFDGLTDAAIDQINKYGDFDIFVNASPEEYKEYITKEAIPFR